MSDRPQSTGGAPNAAQGTAAAPADVDRRAVARRWGSIAFLALLGAVAGAIILALRVPLPDWVLENADRLGTGWPGFALGAVFWALLLSGGALNVAFSCRGLRKVWYPSVAWSVVFGFVSAVALFALGVFEPEASPGDATTLSILLAAISPALGALLAPLGALTVGVVAKDTMQALSGHLARPAGASIAGAPKHDRDLPDDLQWILDERPISDAAEDKFRQGAVVRRLARVLTPAAGTGRMRSIGLVGPYGSGKTSTMEMVAQSMAKQCPGMRFVRVRGWGLEEGGITAFVLRAIIEDLEGDGLDCLAIRGLPEQYLRAISAVHEKTGGLIRDVCQPVLDPGEALGLIEPILAAAGISLLLRIEDVERSCSPEDLQALAAMLDRFRKTDRVAFVLEVNAEQGTTMAVSRICDHVETVPRLPVAETWERLRELHTACVAYSKAQGDVLPAEEAIDTSSVPHISHEDVFWAPLQEFDRAVAELPASGLRLQMATAVGTPRVFKHGLRRAWHDWKKLHGEVDLRELLLLNVLREVAPDAFDFVVRNIDGLRAITRGAHDDAQKKRRVALREAWVGVTAECEWDVDAALAILRAMDLDFTKDHGEAHLRRHAVQTVHTSPQITDYLQRVLSGEVGDGEVRDQDVLREMRDWQAGRGRPLPEKMVDTPGFAQKIEQFRGYLGGTGNERRLCSEYLVERLRVHGARALDDDPSLLVLDTLVTKGVGGGPEYLQFVLGLIDVAMDTSLYMADRLYYRVTRSWVLGGRDDIRAHIRAGMVQRAAGDAEYLGRVLDPAYPYTIYHLVRLMPAQNVPNPTEDWQSFGLHLLAAAKATPAAVVPHMVYVFTDDRRNHPGAPVVDGSPFVFDRVYADALIPDPDARQRLVRVFRDYCGMQGAQAEIATRIHDVMPSLQAFAEGRPDPAAPREPEQGGTAIPAASPGPPAGDVAATDRSGPTADTRDEGDR